MAIRTPRPPVPRTTAGETLALERRRHRFYRHLLVVCLVLMATLVLPGTWSFLIFPGYQLLTLIVCLELGAPLEGGAPQARDHFYRALGVGAMLTKVYWLLVPHHVRFTAILLAVSFSLFYLWTLVRLVSALAMERRVTRQVVSGALAGYLLLGICGGLLLCLIESLYPGSFRSALDGTDPLRRGGTLESGSPLTLAWERNFMRVNYFAFVSLTTVGYGDIIPVRPLAQMTSLMLSIAGPLYIAVVMGVLISRLTAQGEPPAALRPQSRPLPPRWPPPPRRPKRAAPPGSAPHRPPDADRDGR
jgi:voltage-gated potassium channel